MTFLIIVFGTLMLLVGIAIIINPDNIFNLLIKNSQKFWLQATAVLVRLLLGTLLIYQAGVSNYPLAIEIFGWVIILAAIFLIVIGRKKFIQLIAWATSLVKSFGRVAGILAVGFGAFLIYAFV